METKALRKRVDLMAYAMAGTFLIIHIAMLIIFSVCVVIPMIYVNIFSILFYVAMILLIRKSLLTVFAVATFFEINIHMLLAIIFTGWGAGFQITIIGIVILLFFCEYIARSLGLKYIRSVFLAPVAMIVYIVAFVVSLLSPAPYALPNGINITLQISWAVIVFVIMSAVLFIFVSTTTHSQNELSNEVVHDKLTGLPNRYYMASYFQSIEEDESNRRHWVAIADLDDFKSINDTYGHNCGDYVLKTFASLLKDISGDIVVCRWGGEEFLLLGDEGTSPEEILESLREKVESYPFVYEGIAMKLTVTIGFAYKNEGQTADEWIDEADKRLYEGKEKGKNCVR